MSLILICQIILLSYQWNILPKVEEKKLVDFATQLNISPVLAQVLLQRGVDTFEKAKSYFRPSLEMLHDPFLMKGMDDAVNRISQALGEGEKVLIYGDYDVDGTTSVALVYGFLQQFHGQCFYYIPDRYKEGYGVSQLGIDYAEEEGVTLIISLDCGIKAVDMVAYAKQKSIDFIICDHHLPSEQLPDAFAILDPKQLDCKYPYKELCGVGVGFKFMQALCIQQDIPLESLYKFLDLVAIGTSADIVPITDENRILVHYGLQQINQSPSLGVEALMKIVGFIDRRLSVSNLVFGIAPKINAAGRIGHGGEAVALLLEKTKEGAEEKAFLINKSNENRRILDASITQEALAEISLSYPDRKSTVLYNSSWHKGVIGIVASRCIELYYRPTVILTKSGDVAAGSVRSVKGYNVYEAIEQCGDLLEQFGGHAYAAGLTIAFDKIDEFRKRFEKIISDTITDELLQPSIQIDAELSLESITSSFYNILYQMDPFGPENMTPIFISRAVKTKDVKLLKDVHLKIKVTQDGKTYIDVIGFGLGEYYDEILKAKHIDICYTIEENVFRGKTSIQLMLKDVRI